MATNVTQIPGAELINYYFRNYSYADLLSDLPILSLGLATDNGRLNYKAGGAIEKIMSDASGATNLADGFVMITSDSGKANVSAVTEEDLNKAVIGWIVETKTVDFTAENYVVYECDTTGGAIVVTLPEPVGNTFKTRVYKTSSIDTADVTVTTTGGTALIGGETSQVISGTSEGFYAIDNVSKYEIIQDNRGKITRLLSQSTSIISGFDITLNGNDTIDIGSGLYSIENPNQLKNPTSEIKRFNGVTGYVITGANTRGATTIYLTTSNTIQQLLNDSPTPETQITQPRIAVMVHLTSATEVTETAYWWTTGNNPSSRINSLLEFMGVMKRGIVVSGDVAGNLKLQHTSGAIYTAGLETNFTPDRPDKQFVIEQLPVAGMLYATQTTIFDPITDIDPTVYDNAGTLTAVGGSASQCSIWRLITLFNGGVAVQPGQTTYADQATAITSLTQRTDVFITNPIIEKFSILVGYLVVEKGALNLTNIGDATFISADRWGDVQ